MHSRLGLAVAIASCVAAASALAQGEVPRLGAGLVAPSGWVLEAADPTRDWVRGPDGLSSIAIVVEEGALAHARSSDVLAVRSLRRQIVGREIRASVVAFVDGVVVDIGGRQRVMEPVQTAARTTEDQIIFEFISTRHGMNPRSCPATWR